MNLKRYLKYIKPYTFAFIMGPLMMLTEVAGDVCLPKLMSLIINNGVANHDIPYIIEIAGMMMLAIGTMVLGGVLGNYFCVKAAVSFTADMRDDIFGRVQEFSFKNIDEFSTGSLVTRLTNDLTQVQNVMVMGMKLMLRAPGMLIGALIMAFFMNASLAVIVLIVIPILAFSIFTLMRTAFPLFGIMQKKLDVVNTGIQEVLTNVRVVKSFVREDYERDRFYRMNGDLKQSALNAMDVVIKTMPVMTLAMNITTIAIVWCGGNLIIKGKMPVGDLTAFTTYIVQILMSLMMLSMVLLMFARALASMKRIDEVLNTQTDLTDKDAKCKDAEIEVGRVEFKNVGFKYNSDGEEVLKNINLTIEPGTILGIIGSTGSGKTSLVQLIPRLYDATDGEVLVDGINVKDYSLKHLRDKVGMVLQKNLLFSGTIEENLKWGDENASFDDVVAAADSAQADTFIRNFNEGYETEMGQGGVNVSGGQKQRICIARALLKKPKILILDDSTSAVDTATEAKIRQAFQTSLKDTTKIIISQRISSIEYADQIIVLDDGQIIGMGTSEELVASCEAYREIYETQSSMRKEAAV